MFNILIYSISFFLFLLVISSNHIITVVIEWYGCLVQAYHKLPKRSINVFITLVITKEPSLAFLTCEMVSVRGTSMLSMRIM